MKSGALLVQLGIVLALMIILMQSAIPRLTFLDRYKVRSEIEKLSMLFYYLQQRAMVRNHDEELIFDSAGRYKTNFHQEQLSPGVHFGVLSRSLGPPSKPSTLLTNAITFEKQRAVFHADGTISAGTLYVTDTAKTCMYALTVPIGSVSYLRKYRYVAGKWVVL